MRSGRETISWGPPEWGAGAVPPRTINPGELVYAELMPTYAAVETQQQMTVAVGPVDPEWRRQGDVARRSYDAGLEAIKPGITFVELCARDGRAGPRSRMLVPLAADSQRQSGLPPRHAARGCGRAVRRLVPVVQDDPAGE
jgi:hypothetical protein